MTDPTTAIMIFMTRHVNAVVQQLGLLPSDIQLLSIVFASFVVFVILLRTLRHRAVARKQPMTAQERGNLRSVRQQRMPRDI